MGGFASIKATIEISQLTSARRGATDGVAITAVGSRSVYVVPIAQQRPPAEYFRRVGTHISLFLACSVFMAHLSADENLPFLADEQI